MHPKVSVIIPNYNYATYLPQRIDSVLKQTYSNIEIILLDDASTDESAEILCKYANHPLVSRVEVNKFNSGSPFMQWEKGLRLAAGKYVWIAEADDLADPKFLETTVRALELWPEAAFAMTMSYLIDSKGAPSPHKSFDHCNPDGKTLLYTGKEFLAQRIRVMNPCYNASQALIRRDAWLQMSHKEYVGMRYCGDWLFWIEMLRSHDVAEIHIPLNYWRIHGKSTTDRSKVNTKGVRENLMVLHRLLQLTPPLPADTRRVILYRYYRNFLRDSKWLPENEVKTIHKEFFAPLHMNTSRFKLLSAYKHILSPILRIFGAGAAHMHPIKTLKQNHL